MRVNRLSPQHFHCSAVHPVLTKGTKGPWQQEHLIVFKSFGARNSVAFPQNCQTGCRCSHEIEYIQRAATSPAKLHKCFFKNRLLDRDHISLEYKIHDFVSTLVELVGFHMVVQAYLRCADVPGAGGGVALRHLVDAARAPGEAGVSLETCKLEENKENQS